MNSPLPERRQEPRCAHAQPMTADEVTELFDQYVERCGGAHGSEQARALYLSTPALSQAYLRRERRDRRWMLVSILIVVIACVAALFPPHWLGL